MGAHKLDIEFEDDEDLKAAEEAKKKEEEAKKAAAEMEDLEFDAAVGDEEGGSPEAAAPAAESSAPKQKAAPAKAAPAQAAPAQAAPAQAAPVQQQAAPAQAAPVQTGAYMHASPGAANYNLGDELRNVIGGNRILEIELQAKVEIAVTHRMTNYIAEQAQEKKVLETKVNKVLSGIAAKVPALKKELAQIKKLLAEHSAVDKSKLDEDGGAEEAAPKKKKLTPEQLAAKKKAMAAKKKAA